MYRHLIMACLLAFSLTSCSDAPTPPKSTQATPHCPSVFAVYPGWLEEDIPTDSIYWQGFSHIVVAFALPRADGSLNTQYSDKVLAHLGNTARQNDKKIIISIGGAKGYGDAFIQITQDPIALKAFAKNVQAYVSLHNLDGVDIDWEYWTWQATLDKGGNDPRESQLLVNLLAAVRAALGNEIILSTDVFAGSWIGDQYLLDIEKYVDHINLMAFDFTGAWESSKIKHHADYETFKAALEYQIARGFDPKKIVIGLPAYGIEFIDGERDEIIHRPYKEIIKSVDAANINKGRHGNVYFETRPLIQKKTQLAIEKNLHGLFLFDLSLDADQPEESLLGASNETLTQAGCSFPAHKP